MDMTERAEGQRPPAPGPVPWLVFPCGEERKNQTFCTILSSTSFCVELKSIPEMWGKEIWVCFHGWLLLCDTKDDYYFLLLWNPVTFESIKLPPLGCRDIGLTIFTSSPNKSGCTVMLFDVDSPVIIYCQPGDHNWIIHDFAFELANLFKEGYEEIPFVDVACIDGLLYAYMANRPHMVAIEVDNQKCLKLINLGIHRPTSRQFSEYHEGFFLESFGELYDVEMIVQAEYSEETIGLEVFRFDASRMVWMKVDSVKDRSFFLSQVSCTSCLAAESGIEGNQIHFTLPEDKHLYTYDLADGKILTSLPCQNLDTPWYRPSWVKPDFCLPNIQAVKVEEATGGEIEEALEFMEAEANDVDEEEHNPLRRLLQLDISTSIAGHLKVVDYLNFRAACRLFRSAAPVNHWRTKQISWESQFSYPLLVTWRNDQSVFSCVDPKYHNTYFMNIPESLLGTMICCSKDGYLLLADGKSLFCFNPFTKSQGQFPTSPGSILGLGLSSSPSSSDCLVVQINGVLATAMIKFIHPGVDHWWYWRFDTDEEFVPNFNGPVFYHGRFYCLGQEGNLGIFTIDSDGPSWEVLGIPQAPCTGFHQNYLVECHGELVAVFVGRNGDWVRVFMLSHSLMDWVRVESLGSYMLFVSHSSCFSQTARLPGMENKVYFPRFHGGRIVYYSLETNKFHTYGSQEAINSFCGTKEQLYCGWIEPRSN